MYPVSGSLLAFLSAYLHTSDSIIFVAASLGDIEEHMLQNESESVTIFIRIVFLITFESNASFLTLIIYYK